MNRSVYSLVLDDEVVAAVDRLAYRENTSRSQLINRILAGYVSYETPEQRIREAFGRVTAALGGDTFRQTAAPSDTMLSLSSALLYKYNPTVRYSVELFRTENDGEIGELRVYLRTQSRALIAYMHDFYRLFDAIERRHLGPVNARAAEGKYVRRLRPQTADTCAPATVGEAIAAYIRCFDDCLKVYFENTDDPAAAAEECGRIYTAYLSSGVAL